MGNAATIVHYRALSMQQQTLLKDEFKKYLLEDTKCSPKIFEHHYDGFRLSFCPRNINKWNLSDKWVNVRFKSIDDLFDLYNYAGVSYTYLYTESNEVTMLVILNPLSPSVVVSIPTPTATATSN